MSSEATQRTLSAGDPLGTHRVLDPPGALPQPAERLCADTSRHFETEIVVDVETLNIDAASFRQMEEASGGDPDGVARLVLETVARRGKQHNPVTGSGGMLLGVVRRVGALAEHRGFAVGDRIATLASLSLTPLSLRRIVAVRPTSAQIDVEGAAIVFASAPLARMPGDMPERLALALLDVAGAAPQVARFAGSRDSVVVLGAGGKSGLLCAAEARRCVGRSGRVIGLEASPEYAADLRALGICDHVAVADARDPIAVRDVVLPLTGDAGADLTLSCVNVPGVELSAIVATRDRGKAYFFAMSTSFTAAALGAEGIGKDIDLYIGNGYAHGHAEHTLALVRESPALAQLLSSRYG
ncbi:L-erythro-3,5-diaminohexanoate dehydrogenase [Sorangium cellulosum]|uniref:L-erythro-3,5-diaminohexanoate dehydrogenase n=1 Tax=Sorangium cellulosum TaxID=56 RepID=UPI001F23CFBB|nr:L-erythro-3,5-diaminohexanoate dehydrogenase [Sorangium cellulosum]